MQNNMSPLRRVLAGVLGVTKTAACLGLSIALTCSVTARAQTAAPAQTATVFHAGVAWAEFSTLLRDSYAYFERGSVSGKEILGFFAPAALAAKTDEEFIAVLKTVERNFADPHFLVLPRNAQDMSTIPTVSDIYAEWRNGHVVVVDVRANSHAQQNGVVPGDVVLSVDNLPLDQWVVRLLGRPQSKVSIVQANYAANLALAGLRGARRNLTLQRGTSLHQIGLEPARDLALRVAAMPAVSHERKGTIGIIRFNNSLGKTETIAAFDAALDALMDAETLVIDLRNTPSGGNTTIARAVMGRFVGVEKPYQVHEIPYDERKYGVKRKFVEYVAPRGKQYAGRVFVAGGRWTGSMGEGMVIGFDALGATTVGATMAHLLGALRTNLSIESSSAKFEFGTESLFHVNGQRREAFRPKVHIDVAEGSKDVDPVLREVTKTLSALR